MLTVTEAAGAHLAQLLEQQNAAEDIAVRFVNDEKGLVLRQDSERSGDTVFQYDGRNVLFLDADASALLADETLDVEGAALTLNGSGQSEQSSR